MKTYSALAVLCIVLCTLVQVAFAAAPYSGDSANFAITQVVEIPGTYPPLVRAYGGSTRSGSQKFTMLESTDQFQTIRTYSEFSGIVGVPGFNMQICPPGLSCQGYQAFYVDGNIQLYGCTGLSGMQLSGCSVIAPAGLTDMSTEGMTFDSSGNKLLIGGTMSSDTKYQVYAIDLTNPTAAPTRLTACSDSSNHTQAYALAGGYLYVFYQNKYYRFAWNGTTCTGSRQQLSTALGWDNSVNGTVPYPPATGAVGNITGALYFSRTDGSFWVSTKDASCGDSYISGSEKCDSTATPVLNGQTCTSSSTGGPSGFTGGTLACSSCNWDTTSCTGPAVCGNGTKETGEDCDGSDLGGADCASVNGAGWTGTLACSSCSYDTSGCIAPPLCGNNVKESGEACDGTDLGGATCSSVMGVGYTGTLACNACSFDTSACLAPPSCGDHAINGTEDCDASASPAINPADTCATVVGPGYTGSLNCVSCQFDTSACVPPLSCGDGVKNNGEICDGSDLGGATCTSVKGAGWTGTLSCNNCQFVTTGCVFDWGLKNLSGACSVSGNPTSPTVNFTGGACSADYWPINALNPAKIKWASVAGKSLLIAVQTAGTPTVVTVPQGLDHTEVVDNGNHYQMVSGGGFSLAVDGTVYTATWLSATVMKITVTDGRVRLGFNSAAIAGINIAGVDPSVIPAGWGVEVDVFSGTVTNGPYELNPPQTDGGVQTDGGSDATPGQDATPGTDAGTDTGTVTPPGDGGCNCSMASATASGLPVIGLLLVLVAFARRRRG